MSAEEQRDYKTIPLVHELVRHVPFDAHADNLFEEKRSNEEAPEPYETRTYRYVLSLVLSTAVNLVVLTGDAGHGKTHLCRRILEHGGLNEDEALEYLMRDIRGQKSFKLSEGGRSVRIVKDLSEIEPLEEAAELLLHQIEDKETISIVCANEGRLRSVVSAAKGKLDILLDTLETGLESGSTSNDGSVHVINLNFQSIAPTQGDGFLQHILKAWTSDGRRWRGCSSCKAADACPIYRNKEQLGGRNVKSEARRHGLEMLVRAAEQSGYVLTIREALILVAYLISGGVGCEDVHEFHRKSRWEDLQELSFERLLFERNLTSRESEQLGVLNRIRRYDPGLVPHRDIDEGIVRQLEDANHFGAQAWFGADDAAAQATRRQQIDEAKRFRGLVRSARREAYFVDPSPGDAGTLDRARRLGLYHYDRFENVQVDAGRSSAMREIVELVVQGLHIIQGIRPRDKSHLYLVDPAFSRAGSSTSVIAVKIPKRELELRGLHDYWQVRFDGARPKLLDAVDWVARIVMLCQDQNDPKPLLSLNLLQFEFVLRAAEGIFFANFHASERRRILAHLARHAEQESRREDEIRVIANDEIKRIIVERDKSIEVHGGV